MAHDLVTRAATFTPTTVDAKRRTVDLVFTTGAKVLRSSYSEGTFYEELEVSAKAIDLSRLNSGAPFLANHDGSDVARTLGVCESARVEKGLGIATVRFAAEGIDPEADMVFRKIADGIVRSVSVGYRITATEKLQTEGEKIPTIRATRWTPMEISAVTMPADAGAGFRSAQTTQHNPKERDQMDPEEIKKQAITDERVRVSGITHAVRAVKLDDGKLIERLIADGVSLDAARAQMLELLVKRDEETPTDTHHSNVTGGNDLGHDGINSRLRFQAEALAARATGTQPSEQARQYMRFSMVDHARLCLEARGIATRLLSNSQILARSYAGTGDFANLLQGTGDRALMAAYKAAPAAVKSLAKKVYAKDFRPMSRLKLSEAPKLLAVPEHSEITRGSMSEAVESYRVATYARTFGLTRQAIQNDDLQAFELIGAFGRAAAEKEAQLIVDLLASNPVMNDTNALFSAAHGNLTTGPGTAISIASLGVGMAAMRLQKGLDGTTPINAVPDRLLVPAALEVVAMQYTRQLAWAQASNVQPIALEVVVDPRLDAVSPTAWYLFSSGFPCLEIAHLEGADGPIIDVRSGWEVSGVEYRVQLDVGCGAVEHRGAYKNAGA